MSSSRNPGRKNCIQGLQRDVRLCSHKRPLWACESRTMTGTSSQAHSQLPLLQAQVIGRCHSPQASAREMSVSR